MNLPKWWSGLPVTLKFGLVLLVISGYPTFAYVREHVAREQTHSRWAVTMLFEANELDFHGRKVTLSDSLTPSDFSQEDREYQPVRTIVDGRDYSLESPIEVRPYYRDANRYHHWARIGRVTARKTGEGRLAVIQRQDPNLGKRMKPARREAKYRFRILWLDSEGSVEEEWFTFGERAHPRYRTLLGGYVFPTRLAYYSQFTGGYPSLLAPVLYPWLTLVVGLFLALAGAMRLVHRSYLLR